MAGRARTEIAGLFPIIRLFKSWEHVLEAMADESGRPMPSHKEQRKWACAGEIPRTYELAIRRYCGERQQYCLVSDFLAVRK